MINLNPDIDAEIRNQQAKYQAVIDALQPQLARVLSQDHISNIEKIHLVGCGDSFFASLGIRLFFEKVTGLSIEPIEAMEFSRYVCQNANPKSLVLAVSNSGRVSRIIESVIQARKKGMYTIALTGYADRPVAQKANAALIAALPNIRSTLDNMDAYVEQQENDELFSRLSEPGMISRYAEIIGGGGIDFLLFMLGAYTNSLILLYCTAIQIGLVRQKISIEQAQQWHSEIKRCVEIIVRTTYFNLEPIERLTHRLNNKDSFLFLGAGPAYATACLSAAKLFEQPHLNGAAQYLEEWAHLQFFYTRPEGIPIFVIVPPGESRDRALEQIRGIKQLGGTVIAICDSADDEVKRLTDDALLIQGKVTEEFVPWVYGVPGQILAINFLNMKGQPPIPAPYSFKQMMQVNFKQIYGSNIKSD